LGGTQLCWMQAKRLRRVRWGVGTRGFGMRI
jgi:hypothetical protein